MEWRFARSFSVTVTADDQAIRARFVGDFDALTAMAFRKQLTIPARRGDHVILDLTGLEHLDMTGVREIRRLEGDINSRGAKAHIRGATPEAMQLLDYVAPAAALTRRSFGD